MNREQQRAIQYLETENAILREKLGKRRILLNDDQRRRLAIKGKELLRPAKVMSAYTLQRGLKYCGFAAWVGHSFCFPQ